MYWQVLIGVTYCILGLFLICVLNTKKRKQLKCDDNPNLNGFTTMKKFLFYKQELYRFLSVFRIRHGNFFNLKIGLRNIIVINNFDLIKKLLTGDGETFTGKWKPKLPLLSESKFPVLIDQDKLISRRNFIKRLVKDFLSDNGKLTEIVSGECEYVIDEINRNNRKSLNIRNLISRFSLNIFSKIIMNKRFEENNRNLQILKDTWIIETKKRNGLYIFQLLLPKFENSKIIAKLVIWILSKMRIYRDFNKIFEEEIKSHLRNINCNKKVDDLISRILLETYYPMKTRGSKYHSIDKQMIMNSYEIISSNYDITSAILLWSLYFMSNFPDIQKKVHEEIIEVIGSDKLPKVSDKEKLHYTQAVMDEILRVGSPVFLGVFHRAFKDISVDDYTIPKNNLIFLNLFGCHRDIKIWKKPFDFYPDHFLTTSNNGLQYKPRDELIVYGVDRRQVIGECISKIEFFMFFSTILQKFNVKFEANISSKKFSEVFRGGNESLRSPNINNFVFESYNV